MRHKAILGRINQAMAIRESLGDHYNQADAIQKPVNMRTAVFEKRIVRLKRAEKAIDEMITEGMIRYMNKHPRSK